MAAPRPERAPQEEWMRARQFQPHAECGLYADRGRRVASGVPWRRPVTGWDTFRRETAKACRRLAGTAAGLRPPSLVAAHTSAQANQGPEKGRRVWEKAGKVWHGGGAGTRVRTGEVG